MVPNPTRTEQKSILLKAYAEQCQLEKAIAIILENRSANTQLSILGKLDNPLSEDRRSTLYQKENAKNHWRCLMGETEDFGFFSNPEIGTIFIVGPLVSTFLHDVEGTKLAELSAGPYGILRGLGVASNQAGAHIKRLIDGGFILIMRGYAGELKMLEDALISLEL